MNIFISAVVIFLGLIIELGFFINIIAISKNIYVKIFKKKQKPKRKTVNQWIHNIIRSISAMFMIGFIGFIFISNCKTIDLSPQIPDMINKETEAKADVSQDVSEAIQKIPFQNEVLNEPETIWEKMLSQWLMYSEYRKLSEKHVNFAKIRSCYQENSNDLVEWPKIDIRNLRELVKEFHGSELLPATEYTFEEVEDTIESYDDPLEVPADVYKAEFWLWVSSRMGEFTPVVLYQAGRSADDVLKVLYNNGNITVKEWIFFGSMAVSFYLASVECDDGSLDLPLIYYRIAEIFIYLDKYSPLGNDEAYSLHFRLMAEKALGKVEETLDANYDRKKKIPYFSCYYAELLYYFSKLFPDEEENLTDMCREYAAMCVMGDEGEKYCTTCENILKKMN